jgi:hypothetical protein
MDHATTTPVGSTGSAGTSSASALLAEGLFAATADERAALCGVRTCTALCHLVPNGRVEQMFPDFDTEDSCVQLNRADGLFRDVIDIKSSHW